MPLECSEIHQILPQYVKRSISDADLGAVEEHLCVCQECRSRLAKLLDQQEERGGLTQNETFSDDALIASKPEQPNAKETDFATYLIIGVGFAVVLSLAILLLKAR